MQENKLLYQQIRKKNDRKETGIEKILQILQKAHGAQRSKKIKGVVGA